VTYAAIADCATEKQYSVTFMCAQLGVVRHGYYRWLAEGQASMNAPTPTHLADPRHPRRAARTPRRAPSLGRTRRPRGPGRPAGVRRLRVPPPGPCCGDRVAAGVRRRSREGQSVLSGPRAARRAGWPTRVAVGWCRAYPTPGALDEIDRRIAMTDLSGRVELDMAGDMVSDAPESGSTVPPLDHGGCPPG
jgi:hypothetical protein